MTLRILVTLAILAGLAAAPGAQTFRWEPNNRTDVGQRVERALERASRRVDRIVARVRAQVDRRVEAQVRREIRASRDVLRGSRGAWYNDGGQTGTDADPCADRRGRGDDDYRQYCEVRDQTMPAGPLDVNAGPNGGITVEAWDRNEIRVRAIVRANAATDERAKALAAGVEIQAGGGRVEATGPDTSRREWWSVSYRINVPRANDLDLSTRNGGVTISGVSGNLRFDTTNGGVRLSDLGGSVNGRTTNGGLTVNLGGTQWDGEGIDVQTSNGAVSLAIPEGYNAALEARTNNGGMRVDFPITVQGEIMGRRGINATLGSGGPTVRVRTSNGAVRIGRR